MEISPAKPIDYLKRFEQVRTCTENICKPLAPEDYVVQPIVDVSPPKWHLAHTTWFFETFLLQKFDPHYQVFNKDYNFLFNSYYETVGERIIRADRGNLTRPGVSVIYQYREHVDQALNRMLDTFNLPEEFFRVLEIGLHHEQQHQELLITDLKYILGHNPLFPAYFEQRTNTDTLASPTNFLEVPEGQYWIGNDSQEFCFDNELGHHQVFLQAFRVSDRLVTNGEYLEFIEAGGYRDHRLWLMEAWEWVKAENVSAPLYWHLKDGHWYSYDLYGLNALNADAPVTHISFFEADAYTRWRGLRLPTEFEWETACKLYQPTIPEIAQFQDHATFLPTPPSDGNFQFYGDTWEWTSSAYRPYPYYKPEDGALGEYNGKFMINQMVLRGGSCATPRDHIRCTYRNFFHPPLRWQFTGFRLASYL